MGKRLVYLFCFLLVLATAGSCLGELVGHWKLDEGSGAKAVDSSGKGNDGTLVNKPTWIAGVLGSALEFHGLGVSGGGGDYITCPNSATLDVRGPITIAMWIRPSADDPEGKATTTAPMAKADQNASVSWSWQVRYGWGSTKPYMAFTFNTSPRAWAYVNKNLTRNEWCHIACSHDGTTLKCYLNGEQTDSTPMGAITSSPTPVLLGTDGWGCDWMGAIDDVQLYNNGLTAEEIKAIMTGPAKLAADPTPADGAVDVPQDAALRWVAGKFAATHDVYIGKTLADVNNASRTMPAGLLASQGQTATTYAPAAPLDCGQTYYWRIDEVNAAPDNTIFKGNVWSFTAEPYGYPITSVTATASSAQPGMGPENTINGSGLTGDLHGTDGTTMWLSSGVQPNWIQYQFDKAYKLYDLKVWNSNGLIESFIGFGAKKVTIEYSADGATWTALDNVPEFARAPGTEGYAAGAAVSFGGVLAQYVKLTINSTWGGVSPVTGLSEVRFSYVPVQARAPQPATAATGVAVDAGLNWRPGREASSHKVFFGTDQAAVAGGTATAKTVTDHAFTPGSLNYGTTYYWKVDEVGAVTYPGDVWKFTTQEYAVVDDFESYNDDDNRIYDAWIDGYTDGKSGSTVGYMNAPFAEQTIIHGGKQSMPFEYNNVKAPYYSEASRTFDATQNWTTNGADTVSLFYRGRAAGFLDNGNGTFTMSSSGADIWGTADQFRFAYKSLNGDGTIVARVDSLANTNAWAKGGVMIRQSVDAGSTHAFMPMTISGGNGASFQRRLAANGASTNDDKAAPAVAAPYWVKVERKGNSFTGSISPDGKTWTQLGAAQTIVMTNPVLIGLAVCSHDAALTTVAEISNVSTTGTVTGSWQNVAIGMAMPTNGAASLYLTVEDKAGKTKTVVNPNPSASATAGWTQWKIALSDLTGVNLTAVKKITLGAGDKVSPKAGAAGMLYFDDLGYGHPAQ